MEALDLNNLITTITSVVAALVGVFTIAYTVASNQAREGTRQSFQTTVKGLFSLNIDERISSAILLRRFLNRSSKEGRDLETFKMESINVISALLKKERCGEYQKTLSDSLSYTANLDKCDFQYANLQNVYLAPNNVALKNDFTKRKFIFKKEQLPQRISMHETDLFMADLSYSNINEIDAIKAKFYKANLYQATFRDCNLTNADFRGAYLDGVRFINCNISEMNTIGSYGTPNFKNCEGVIKSNEDQLSTKQVFISCPGALTPKQSDLLRRVEANFKAAGIEITQYKKHKYRETGQLSAIKTEIANSNGVVILGFKDMKVVEGRYRPNTEEFRLVNEEIIASPWINIEAGIASGTNKPILLLFDDRLDCGLFHDSITDHQITKIKINSTNYALYDDKIDKWIRQIN